MEKIELYILRGLLEDNNFCTKFIHLLDESYFSFECSCILRCIKKFYERYQTTPSVKQIINTLLPKLLKNDEEKIEQCIHCLNEAVFMEKSESELKTNWLIDETKTFIKMSRIKKALSKSIEFVEKGDPDTAVNILLKATEIHFDEDLGLNYFGDLEKRIEEIKQNGVVIPTGYPSLDKAIGGGWRPKSLIIFAAPTNGGKTLILCDITTKLMDYGLNGLYITLEINQSLLASRIDANLTNISVNDTLKDTDLLIEKIKKLRKQREEKAKVDKNVKPFGELIIKEAIPNIFTANTIEAFIKELKLKKNFVPDFICIDYLALMTTDGKSFADNTYGKLKTITEQVRNIAMVHNIPIFTAVQVNREGYKSSSLKMDNISDSMGVAFGADVIIMVNRPDMQNEEDKKDNDEDENDILNEIQEQYGEMIWYVAKSRWSRNGTKLQFYVDYEHMRVIDPKNDEQQNQILSDFIKEKLSTIRNEREEFV